MSCLIDGVQADLIDVADRGFQYGDGLFETIPWRDGRLELWSLHMARLRDGCDRLGLAEPDIDLLAREALSLCRDMPDSVLKIIITRGSGGRGYRPPESPLGRRVLSLHPLPSHLTEPALTGITVRLCDTRLAVQPQLAGLKHLNRLEQVLARREWCDPGIAEGLMLNTDNQLIEGTQTNLFFVQDGQLYTPDLSGCGVSGIIRQVIIDMAKQENIPGAVGDFSLAAIEQADEVFVTNSVIGIWPVIAIGHWAYGVGELTQRLQGLLRERVGLENTR